jgi:hypothetical protein
MKIKQFAYKIGSFEWYGLAEIEEDEELGAIVTVTDLYLEGYRDDNPPDMVSIVNYQLVLDIADMVRIEFNNGR